MGKVERITVELPEDLAAAVRAAVSSGEYPSTGDVVREALRDWQAEQRGASAHSGSRAREDVLAMIAEGEKGPFLDGPTVLAELRTKYRIEPE